MVHLKIAVVMMMMNNKCSKPTEEHHRVVKNPLSSWNNTSNLSALGPKQQKREISNDIEV